MAETLSWLRMVLLGVLVMLAWPAQALENSLKQHPSPYLALHGSDPVAWQEWNADTVARAKRENKLLFVSVGYYACHWCHVMQRESYKNPDIAAQLNRAFIPVKVDRELNTGLDETLQEFSARLLKLGGWPLNAFVTPEGHPIYVVLYAPPAEFSSLLVRLDQRWSADAAGVRELARRASAPRAKQREGAALSAREIANLELAFMAQARRMKDEFRGGFGEVSKFPMAPQLELLLERQAKTPDAEWGAFLRLTLDQMATRGLRDHVHGGFFRYTTDPGWETPHFEKMLYDNAQLARLYLCAAEVLKEPRYRAIGLETVDFMLRTLEDAQGGFHTSVSALDAQGEEGGHYVWTEAELKARLTSEEYVVARRVWKLDQPAPFPQGYLPAEWRTPSAREAEVLRAALAKLRAARPGLPPRDTKRIAGLNGLALSALSAAMREDARYVRHAESLVRFLSQPVLHQGHGKKALSGQHWLGEAELEDRVYLAQGLLDYAQVSGKPPPRELAQQLLKRAWADYADASGWRRERVPLLVGQGGEAVLSDGPVPSSSALWLMGVARLGDARLLQRPLRWRAPEVMRYAFDYPTQIRALIALRTAKPAPGGVPP